MYLSGVDRDEAGVHDLWTICRDREVELTHLIRTLVVRMFSQPLLVNVLVSKARTLASMQPYLYVSVGDPAVRAIALINRHRTRAGK